MNRGQRGSPLSRAANLRADGGQPDIPIDLTLTSDSDSEASPALQHDRRLGSELESEDDMIVPIARPQLREARAPPRREVLVIDSPPPDLKARSQAARPPRQRISSSPEFQARPFGKPPRHERESSWEINSSPSLSPDYEVDSDVDLDLQLAMRPRGNGQPDQRSFARDYIMAGDFDDAIAARQMEQFREGHRVKNGADHFQPGRQQEANALDRQPVYSMGMESKLQCIEAVVAIFPGICMEYLSEIYGKVSKSSDRLIAYILDKIEKGSDYPKAKQKENDLKRKRELDEDEEANRKYGSADRIIRSVGGIDPKIQSFVRNILGQEFEDIPMSFIDKVLGRSGHRLFSAYRVLEEAQRTFDPDPESKPPYKKIRKRKPARDYKPDKIPVLMDDPAIDPLTRETLEELIAARRIREKADLKRAEARRAELDEIENTRKAEAEGNMSECGCCLGDYPLNRMIHCDASELHWFCRGCALKAAQTEIENGRYELKCMSMDGCLAGFSMEQRSQYLDANTIIALERNEQESNLRLAGIENLASCPFCPYAAEYPPIELNSEFECARPDCEKVSCRRCKLESHIPKSCKENARDNGLSIRRQIEEAMSAALIRKCNKCQTPFIKVEGCNKMTCTRSGCRNIQCYVCSKSCGYNHFNDSSRGGKPGNCPLFESAEHRHDQEVKEAERLAMEKVRADHPEYSEEDLRVKMSEAVQMDDDRRKANDPQIRREAAMRPGVGVGPGHQEIHDLMIAHVHQQRPNAAAPPLGIDRPLRARGYVFRYNVDFENRVDDGDDVLELLNRRANLPGFGNVAGGVPRFHPGLEAMPWARAPQIHQGPGFLAQVRPEQLLLQQQRQNQPLLLSDIRGRAHVVQPEIPNMIPQLPPAPRLFEEFVIRQPAAQQFVPERGAQLEQINAQLGFAQQLLNNDVGIRPPKPQEHNLARHADAGAGERQVLKLVNAKNAFLQGQLNELQAANPGLREAAARAAVGLPLVPPERGLAEPLEELRLVEERLRDLRTFEKKVENRLISRAGGQIRSNQDAVRVQREQEIDEAIVAREWRQNGEWPGDRKEVKKTRGPPNLAEDDEMMK